MTQLETLIQQARSWIAQDPDAETVAELEKLISESDEAGLLDRFGQRIGFGTAGLRGLLGAGPNRMNRVLVAQAAAGISKYLKENFDDPSVVIGYDARKNSDVFAKDSAQIFAGFGIRAHLFPELAATPLVAYAVRNLGASAGVMVTASHNPPGDHRLSLRWIWKLQNTSMNLPSLALLQPLRVLNHLWKCQQALDPVTYSL
jgi:phosphomannomutase